MTKLHQCPYQLQNRNEDVYNRHDRIQLSLTAMKVCLHQSSEGDKPASVLWPLVTIFRTFIRTSCHGEDARRESEAPALGRYGRNVKRNDN